MLVWRQVLRNARIFADLGASVGICAIWAAELGAKVIALELAAGTFGPAELPVGHGCQLYRPDAAERLTPAPDPGSGADAFASPLPGGSLS